MFCLRETQELEEMEVSSIIKNICSYAELIRCDVNFQRQLARCTTLTQLETTVNNSYDSDNDVANYAIYLISRYACGKA